MFKNKKGFTLIELLVVIAIIGLLASIVMVSINTARTKARDARRKADLDAMRTALEMYSNDIGTYPVHATAVNSAVACTAWISELTSSYLSKQPCDPTEATYHYYYISNAGGTQYELDATMESDTTAATTDGGNSDTLYEIGTTLTLR